MTAAAAAFPNPTASSIGTAPAVAPSNDMQNAAMVSTSVALLLAPGPGEVKAGQEAVTVYRIVEEGETTYVGITNNIARRSLEHGKDLETVTTGLTRNQARGVEQALIEQHGLAQNGGTLTNKINSISKSNPIYEGAVTFGRQLLKSIVSP